MPRVRYRVSSRVLCAIAAVAVHGGLLALTLPESTQSPEPPPSTQSQPDLPQPDPISIAVLPRPTEEEVTPAPTPEIDQSSEPASSPQAASAPQPRTETAPAAPPPEASPAPPPVAETTPPPVAETTPPTVAETTPPPPTVETSPAPSAETIPETPPTSRYANFPHLEGAEANCGEEGDCWRSPVRVSWRNAANTLREQLESQGYTVTNVTGEVLTIDTGVRVYEVSKAGEDQYYLHVISVGDGLLYTMRDEPMNTEQVEQLQQS